LVKWSDQYGAHASLMYNYYNMIMVIGWSCISST
jgi:hypothetical protein